VTDILVRIQDALTAAVRTGAAGIGAYVIAWLIGLGVTIPDGFALALTAVLFGLILAGWNLAIGLAVRYVHPWFGYLLIVAKSPTYTLEPADRVILTRDEVLEANADTDAAGNDPTGFPYV